jgi:hypothetical protein
MCISYSLIEVAANAMWCDECSVSVSLDTDSIWYMRQLIATDLAYYPERLHRMIIINSPWYFPALYNMFKPFIDSRTREKIIILGTDYHSVLAEYADLSEIPLDYGGEDASIVWGSSSFSNESGLSLAQMEEKQVQLLESRDFVLTNEEMISLHYAFSHPKYCNIPETIHKRNLLESWMQDIGVDIPSSVEEPSPPPPPPGINPAANIGGQSDTPALSLQVAIQNKDALFAMPQLQVCDVLSTGIVGIEVSSCCVFHINH